MYVVINVYCRYELTSQPYVCSKITTCFYYFFNNTLTVEPFYIAMPGCISVYLKFLI